MHFHLFYVDMQDSTAYSRYPFSTYQKSGDSFITAKEFLAKIVSTVKALLTKKYISFQDDTLFYEKDKLSCHDAIQEYMFLCL